MGELCNVLPSDLEDVVCKLTCMHACMHARTHAHAHTHTTQHNTRRCRYMHTHLRETLDILQMDIITYLDNSNLYHVELDVL